MTTTTTKTHNDWLSINEKNPVTCFMEVIFFLTQVWGHKSSVAASVLNSTKCVMGTWTVLMLQMKKVVQVNNSFIHKNQLFFIYLNSNINKKQTVEQCNIHKVRSSQLRVLLQAKHNIFLKFSSQAFLLPVTPPPSLVLQSF